VIAEPGVIRHTAMDHLIFGELDKIRSARLIALQEACRPAGFQSTLSDDIVLDILGQVRPALGLERHDRCHAQPLGIIRDDPDLWTMLRRRSRKRRP